MSPITTIIRLEGGERVYVQADAPASGNWQTLKVISSRDGVIASTTAPPGADASIGHFYMADAGDFTAEIIRHPERD